MKRATLMLAALTLLLGGGGQARAQVTYDFTYSDGSAASNGYGDYGTGTLILPAAGTGIASSGTLNMMTSFDNNAFTGMYTLVLPTTNAPGVNGPFDNMVYPGNDGPGYLTSTGGLIFAQPVPGSMYDDYINIFYTGSSSTGYEISASVNGSNVTSGVLESGMFTLIGPVNSVPEPSGIALLGLGVACLAIGYSVRRRKPALVAA